MTDIFLADLERDSKPTRRVLERVPEGRDDWKPHEKSMQLGYLAALVATMPRWVAMIVNQDELDLAAGGTGGFAPKQVTGGLSLIDALDDCVRQAREALTNTNDDHLMTNWRLRMGERVLAEDPRHVTIRETFHHLAHHRGQLTVYLRLNDIAVPSIYGPSADEQF
ncbi:MAG TPA: hypothetical protein VKB93_24785 [Thermoanaerobaculia bacterium]|nr:hypothetical protein [Thermoanaerobaculia bacterium]